MENLEVDPTRNSKETQKSININYESKYITGL